MSQYMQKQKQLSKQTQLIDQSFSNGIMLNAIAALENLAHFYGYKGPRIFDYYSGYAKKSSEEQLINAVILQLEIFRNSHLNYTSIYSDYDFPKNLRKDQIIKIIMQWRSFIPYENIQIFFNEIINYLGGFSSNSGINEIIQKKKEEWGPTTEKDLERIARNAPYINSIMFNQMDEAKDSYNKTGEYEIKAKLNQPQEANKEMENINNQEQLFNEKLNKFALCEAKIESFFGAICSKINNHTVTSQDIQMIENEKKLFKTLIKGIYFDEQEINQIAKKYEKFKKDIFKLKTDDKKAINYLSAICDEIVSCYKHNNRNNANKYNIV